MANKANRILESIKSNAGVEVYEDITAKYGIPEQKWTPNKQSKYINSVLTELENSYGEDLTAKIMKRCGGQCLSNNVIEKAKAIYQLSKIINYPLVTAIAQLDGSEDYFLRFLKKKLRLKNYKPFWVEQGNVFLK